LASDSVRLRDRDAVETAERLIFRVFGYSHPPGAYICDAEYASSKIFESKDPRAPRTGKGQLYFKFYNDEGMKLVFKKYPQYQVFHEMLGLNLVGVKEDAIVEARKPEVRLQKLLETEPTDELLAAMERVLMISLSNSGLKTENFGVFGSMLHGFHHPKYSDIDLIVYGKKENSIMRKSLQAM
jgi:predicted nucleotidyltransferase